VYHLSIHLPCSTLCCFGYITVITITHVMRMTHMHHHSSWFLVCETIRERRRRHHRVHGWPQAADTPSFLFFGQLTRINIHVAAPHTTAAISHIRRAHETRHRSTGRDLSSCDNHSYIGARRSRARDAGEFMQRATLTAPVTRDARTLRDTTQNKYTRKTRGTTVDNRSHTNARGHTNTSTRIRKEGCASRLS
jgi:hypothetical protein